MPDEIELQSATNLAVTAAWVVGAVVAAYFLGVALSWTLLRLGRRSRIVTDIASLTRRPLRAVLMVIAAGIALQRASNHADTWRAATDHTLQILGIGAATWLAASFVLVAERHVVGRFGGGNTEMTEADRDADQHRRRIRTQVTTLRRLVIAIVVILGGAAALMTFPAFTDIGTTLFASAGVLSVVAGLAAQTSLGSVFAGMQIAFSDAIRVGDVVVLEDEWGRIEEITLTYVVVQLWDQRRLVLPTTYFTTTPFQNWTRNATELLGTVEIDVDFTVPLDGMRTELQRQLAASELWDGRVGIVQVTDAIGGYVRVRMLVSAPNAPALFDLRCEVREGMVDWLHRTSPDSLPHWRFEETRGAVGRDREPVHATRDRRGSSALFTGGKAAEHRARVFAGRDGFDERTDMPRGYDGN